ncbi:MAG: GGDEF domain-containing protein [Spirochaetia bacterium]|nr:GGDEF domain-containing protein [Spirochaetia bacterium]
MPIHSDSYRRIEKRIITAGDIMSSGVLTAAPEDPVLSMMEPICSHKTGTAVVIDRGGTPAGIITRSDIIRTLLKGRKPPFFTAASSVMSYPVISVSPGDDIELAHMLMEFHGISRLPVTEHGFLSGIITYIDVAASWRSEYRHFEEISAGLKNRVFNDWLTGLYNRHYMTEELTRQLRISSGYGSPLSVIMFDVDRFKDINDTYGHGAGDEVLRGLAAVIRQNMGTINVAGRYGGDEFMIIAPLSGAATAMSMAEQLRRLINTSRFKYAGRLIKVTVSAGIASRTKRNGSCQRLLHAVDKALYTSKHSGRNSITGPSYVKACAPSVRTGPFRIF